jgi:next-to-BRCA1 protein 1
MSTSTPQTASVTPSTLITVKILYNDNTRRFKIPLKELEARVLPQKVCPHPSSDQSLRSSRME